jgi:hypothetical protein
VAVEVDSSGFDPESLERAARLLRKLNSSKYAKQLFELMRMQEKTRLAELEAEKVQYIIQQHLRDIVSAFCPFLDANNSMWYAKHGQNVRRLISLQFQ